MIGFCDIRLHSQNQILDALVSSPHYKSLFVRNTTVQTCHETVMFYFSVCIMSKQTLSIPGRKFTFRCIMPKGQNTNRHTVNPAL